MDNGGFPVYKFAMAGLLAVNLCFAFDPKTDITLHGTVFFQDGDVVSGKYDGKIIQTDFTNMWLPKSALNFTLEADPAPWLSIVLEPEFQAWVNSIRERWFNMNLSGVYFTPQYSTIIQNAYGNIHFGGTDSLFQIQIGRFLYKYNPEAVNLGEYLFRTGCYPGNIINDFDFTYARLTGIHLSSTLLGGSLKQDLFLTIEQEIVPFGDWSLSYVAGYNVGNWLTLGVGGSLWRIFPADDSTTTPREIQNSYMKSDSSTGYYTFGGTKLMARAMLDVKPFLGAAASIFGKQDLKIFAEAAVLGLQDYDIYKDTVNEAGTHFRVRTSGIYDSLWQRIPIMFGMNLPAFKLLDKFALQFEWYGSPWPIGPYARKFDEYELPKPSLTNSDALSGGYNPQSYNYHTDDWKWSLYAKKNVADCFSIIAQVGRDHLKGPSEAVWQDITDMMPKPSNWYWMVKTQFMF